MIRTRVSTILFLCGIFTSAISAASTPISVEFKDGKGQSVGQATLTNLVNGVRIELNLHNLPAGEHALHFHEKASCVGPKFESAGGHFTTKKGPHGFDMQGGPHAGDMANFFVSQYGVAKVEVINMHVTLAESGANSLFRDGGTALVIHEKADDYKSQPAGDAGARIACAEIKQPSK